MKVLSEITGTVWKVEVQPGQSVAEGDTLLIVDLPRPPSPVHLAKVLSLIAPALVWPFAHDGLISSMRAYSPSALRALAAHADPAIEVEITSGSGLGQFLVAARQTVVARRPR